MTHALVVAALVMIRTYNYVQVPADDLARARATANRTFQDAGISLRWVDCAVPSSIVDRRSSIVDRLPAEARSAKAGPSLVRRSAQRDGGSIIEPAACAQPLREGLDFVLRLVPAPGASDLSSSRIVPMGSSFINHDSRSGALTTVDPELVQRIARGSGVDFATLLGRAIAHEIGHLLLGHSHHSRDGLMRAVWLQDEIRGIRIAGWQFSAAEAAQMRLGLASRARSAN